MTVSGRLTVDATDANLRGHFPGQPVLPGVFVIEALCQLMELALDGDGPHPPTLSRLTSVRFLAPLLGGDRLTLTAQITTACGGAPWQVRAEGIRRDGVVAARIRAEFTRKAPEDTGAVRSAALTGDSGVLDHAA